MLKKTLWWVFLTPSPFVQEGLDKFYLLFEPEIQQWPKLILNKVAMHEILIENTCKLAKTDKFFSMKATSLYVVRFFSVYSELNRNPIAIGLWLQFFSKPLPNIAI